MFSSWEETSGLDLSLLLMASLLLALSYGNRYWARHDLGIALRWLRWAFFSFFLAHLSIDWGQSTRPMVIWIVIWAGIWFLMESLYHWIAIKALGFSEVHLFPRFVASGKEGYWPASSQSKKIKKWLKENHWKYQFHAEAQIVEEVNVDCHVYLSADDKCLLQILWIPGKAGTPTAFYSLQCQDSEGNLWITDNIAVAYGGYYPHYWYSLRKPWISAVAHLWQRHQSRITDILPHCVAYSGDLLDLLNKQQHALEQFNWKEGFMVDPGLQEEEGKLTEEGRYRIWKEMWLIRYLGVVL